MFEPSWDGPTTVTDPWGDFQHHPWVNQNGLAMFRTKGWVTSNNQFEKVPDNQVIPGSGGYSLHDGLTFVASGSAGPNTFWTFDGVNGVFNDTGKEATPLVAYGSDGSVQQAGYNPANGQWINADGSVGIAPANQAAVKETLAQIRDLATAALR